MDATNKKQKNEITYDNTMSNPRSRATISLDAELMTWIDKQVDEFVEYRDRSHLIEIALTRFRELKAGN